MIKKINIPFKFRVYDRGCLIACLEMVLKIMRPGFQINDFIKILHKNKFGYNIQEVAEKLIEQGFRVEYGFYDKDIVGQNFPSKPPLFKNLKKILDEQKIHPEMIKDLKDTIEFVTKYPKNIKIRKTQSKDLMHYIDQSLPVIVHLGAKSLGAKTEEEIHAVIVNGYNEKGFYIVNPPKIKEEHIAFRRFLRFWNEGGNYYLVISKDCYSLRS